MGRTVDTQKQQIRDRVPGKSLKDKMTHLYLENPERKVEEYMMKLSLTRDQVYGLKHIVKKALEEKNDTQGQSEQASARLEPQYMQTSISENELPGIDPVTSPTPQHSFSNMEDLLPFDIGTSTNESAQQKPVEQTPPVYQQPVYQQQSIQEPVYQQNAQENTYQQQNHVQQPVQVSVQQPMHQQQSMYQQQPMQEQPVQQQQPIEQTYQQQSYQQQPVYQQQQPVYQQESVEQVYQQQSMYQQPVQEPVQQPVQYQIYQQQPIEQTYQQQPIPQQKPMYQPIAVQRKTVQQKPVQHLVLPTPEIDINLSDVDGITLKSFLAITSDKVKNGAKYTLELKLVEC